MDSDRSFSIDAPPRLFPPGRRRIVGLVRSRHARHHRRLDDGDDAVAKPLVVGVGNFLNVAGFAGQVGGVITTLEINRFNDVLIRHIREEVLEKIRCGATATNCHRRAGADWGPSATGGSSSPNPRCDDGHRSSRSQSFAFHLSLCPRLSGTASGPEGIHRAITSAERRRKCAYDQRDRCHERSQGGAVLCGKFSYANLCINLLDSLSAGSVTSFR